MRFVNNGCIMGLFVLQCITTFSVIPVKAQRQRILKKSSKASKSSPKKSSPDLIDTQVEYQAALEELVRECSALIGQGNTANALVVLAQTTLTTQKAEVQIAADAITGESTPQFISAQCSEMVSSARDAAAAQATIQAYPALLMSINTQITELTTDLSALNAEAVANNAGITTQSTIPGCTEVSQVAMR